MVDDYLSNLECSKSITGTIHIYSLAYIARPIIINDHTHISMQQNFYYCSAFEFVLSKGCHVRSGFCIGDTVGYMLLSNIT